MKIETKFSVGDEVWTKVCRYKHRDLPDPPCPTCGSQKITSYPKEEEVIIKATISQITIFVGYSPYKNKKSDEIIYDLVGIIEHIDKNPYQEYEIFSTKEEAEAYFRIGEKLIYSR